MLKFDNEVLYFNEEQWRPSFRYIKVYSAYQRTNPAKAQVKNLIFRKTGKKRFFFVEEARLFVKFINEMKKHPIRPSDYFYQTELDQQKERFRVLQQKFQANEEEALRETGRHKKQIEDEIEQCKSRSSRFEESRNIHARLMAEFGKDFSPLG